MISEWKVLMFDSIVKDVLPNNENKANITIPDEKGMREILENTTDIVINNAPIDIEKLTDAQIEGMCAYYANKELLTKIISINERKNLYFPKNSALFEMHKNTLEILETNAPEEAQKVRKYSQEDVIRNLKLDDLGL
jgi:hypothetical protein